VDFLAMQAALQPAEYPSVGRQTDPNITFDIIRTEPALVKPVISLTSADLCGMLQETRGDSGLCE